ncbi:hypothetical protein C461_05327 [Halorubrum aidingense JCM 13560]|uniref:Uncharacterized protein n=1 Tax=Halorubrum aidingense JCM 13560 TaxID=1230454 RepID=M0PG54_9EURY|nr:hypothetical protein [Halorubrum aidingense]EMA69026.1 hypothetical protein C461_05327 [Halorubrum aidingense JCM 13560]
MTRDTDDLPELFEEQRDEYDDAGEIVDAALNTASRDVTPDEAPELVAAAQLQIPVTIDDHTHELAVRTTESEIRDNPAA